MMTATGRDDHGPPGTRTLSEVPEAATAEITGNTWPRRRQRQGVPQAARSSSKSVPLISISIDFHKRPC
jgi:hypothetical protein